MGIQHSWYVDDYFLKDAPKSVLSLLRGFETVADTLVVRSKTRGSKNLTPLEIPAEAILGIRLDRLQEEKVPLQRAMVDCG